MQPQLRLVDHDRRGWVRLQEQSRQCDQAKRSVREGVSVEVDVRAAFPPFQPDLLLVERIRTQVESVEEGSCEADGLDDLAIHARVSCFEEVEECRKVRAVRAEEGVVVN